MSEELYALDVRDGTAGSEALPQFEAAAVVEISSNPPAGDQRFVNWSGQTGTVEDIFAAATTVYMPASNVTLQAVYAADTFLLVAKVGGEGGSVSAESESGACGRERAGYYPDPASARISRQPDHI